MAFYESICQNGLLGAYSNMGKFEESLGKLVWTYPYKNENDIEVKHKKMLKKKKGTENPKSFGICIRITGISEDDLNRLYTRYGYIMDGAIVYRGEKLNPENIELIKQWD